jgi:very-short-patch-repair endonuclease
MAAILALGEGAVLSHQSAAALWKLLPMPPGSVDVSLTNRSGRQQRDGIRVHRPGSLEAREITSQCGIPVTSPARTLADLRTRLPAREFRRAVRQADFLGLATGAFASDRTRSELERRFLWLCNRHRLPKPGVNTQIGEMTVDFCWREQGLIVETDGYKSHRGREAFEGDRARDLRLRTLGYEVLRLSYRQVFDEPRSVLAALRPALIPDLGAT